jgi:hypothetical protein
MKREEKMERHTRITINTSELTLIKKLHGLAEADCLRCGARVEMATPEQAVTLTGIHSRTIYGWVESGQVHFLETIEGHLLICLVSLLSIQQDKPHLRPALPPATGTTRE